MTGIHSCMVCWDNQADNCLLLDMETHFPGNHEKPIRIIVEQHLHLDFGKNDGSDHNQEHFICAVCCDTVYKFHDFYQMVHDLRNQAAFDTTMENQADYTDLPTVKVELVELITDAYGDDELEEKEAIPKLELKPPPDASPTPSPPNPSIPAKVERRCSKRRKVQPHNQVEEKQVIPKLVSKSPLDRFATLSPAKPSGPTKVEKLSSQRKKVQRTSVAKCSKKVDKSKVDREILEFYKRLVCRRCEPQQIALGNPIVEYNSFLELERHYRKEHKISKAPVQCPVCRNKYRTRRDLLVHKDIHVTPEKYRCKECLELHLNLDQDMKTQRNEKYHSCTKCGKIFASQHRLTSHMQNFHKTGRKAKVLKRMTTVDHELLEFYIRLVCERCDPQRGEPWVEYKNLSELNRHSVKEHKKRKAPVKCPLCSNHYAARTDLLKHKDMHLNPDNHRCKECLEVHQNMDLHMKTKHSEKLHSCTECDTKFASPGQLKKHMRVKHHTPYDVRCDQCNKLFSKYTIYKHKQVQHGVGYICEYCPTSFKCRYRLQRHIEHHKGANSKLRPVACPKCNTVLKDIYQLRAHNRLVHGAQNPVVCKSCGKMYKSKASLYKHMKEICTERKLECPLCGKLFKQERNLQEHMSTHTGVPLYVCNFCPETFKFQSHFYTHRKNAHPKEWLEIREKKKDGIQHKIQHLRNGIHNPDFDMYVPK